MHYCLLFEVFFNELRQPRSQGPLLLGPRGEREGAKKEMTLGTRLEMHAKSQTKLLYIKNFKYHCSLEPI